MLYTDCTVTINGEKSVIDRPVVLYRGDKEVEIKFYIMKNTFYQSIVTKTTNVVSDVDASFSQLVIRIPEGEPIFSAVTPVEEDGAIIFKFTAEMIDEVREVGSYDFQIRLLDENKTSRATIPPVIEGIKIKEPIAIESEPSITNDSNEVNVAQVNEAIITTATQLPAFDEQGNYIETTWTDKMLITDAKLNKIEDGITGVNEKIANLDLSGVDLTGYAKTEDIPTRVSQLTNDSNYVNTTQMNEAIANVTGQTIVEPQALDMPKVFFYGNTLPTTKENVNLTMDYVSNTTKFSSFVKLKCQGNSSMSYAKKNFTINMYSDEARATKLKKDFKGWGAQSKFCLKANYIDTTHTRNLSGARIAYDMVASRPDSTFKQQLLQCPRNGLVDGFPIKLYFNGEFYGIYTWNIPKDTWMFNMDKSNLNHIVLCAEKNTDGNSSAINSCQFRQLWTNGDGQDWSVEVGTMSEDLRTKFNRVINFVMTATDQEFHDNIGQYFDLYSLLDYYCFSYFVNHLDGLAKNMLMVTYDGVIWGASLYDMDSIYGVSWNGASFVSPQYQCPEQYQEQFSRLWVRIEQCFATELYARYRELRQGALSLSNIVKHVEEIYDVIPDRVFADEKAKWTSLPQANTNTMTRFRNYMRDRAVYVDTQMREIGTPQSSVECTGISLDKNTLTLGVVEGGGTDDSNKNYLENATWELGMLKINGSGYSLADSANDYRCQLTDLPVGTYILHHDTYTFKKIGINDNGVALLGTDVKDYNDTNDITFNITNSKSIVDISLFPNGVTPVGVTLTRTDIVDIQQYTFDYNNATSPGWGSQIDNNYLLIEMVLGSSNDIDRNKLVTVSIGDDIYYISHTITSNATSFNALSNKCNSVLYSGNVLIDVAVPKSKYGNTLAEFKSYCSNNGITNIYINKDIQSTSGILSAQLTATVIPTNCTQPVVWSVSPAGIVTVNNGLVTAVANGEATVTATCGTQTATCAVTVSGMSESGGDTPEVPEENLLCYYDSADLTTSSTTWADKTGNGRDLAINKNGEASLDITDQGLLFYNVYCRTPELNIPLTGNFTVEYELTRLGNISGVAMYAFNSTVNKTCVYCDSIRSNHVYAVNGYNTDTNTDLILTQDHLYKIRVIYGNEITLYADGVLIGTYTRNAFTANGTYQLCLGFSGDQKTPILNSRIKSFKLWDGIVEPSGGDTGETYTDIEYIESTGTQYINTRIVPTASTKIELVAEMSASKQYDHIFGSDNFIKVQWMNDTGTAIYATKKNGQNQISGLTLGKHTYIMDMTETPNVITIDGTKYGTIIGSLESTTYSLLLLCGYNNGNIETQFCGVGKIYSCKIYYEDTLVANMKPVLTNSGTYGLLDTVNNTFYGSEVGSFTGGGTPSGGGTDIYATAEYAITEPRTFNGTSDYIDTGIKLFDTAKTFTIFVDYASSIPTQSSQATIFHCLHEVSPYRGLCIMKLPDNGAYFIGGQASGQNTYVTNMPSSGKYIISFVNGVINNVVTVDDSGSLVYSATNIGDSNPYVQISENLLIGCYQDSSGTKGRFWSGTINKFGVWFKQLTEAEINQVFRKNGGDSGENPNLVFKVDSASMNTVDNTLTDNIAGISATLTGNPTVSGNQIAFTASDAFSFDISSLNLTNSNRTFRIKFTPTTLNTKAGNITGIGSNNYNWNEITSSYISSEKMILQHGSSGSHSFTNNSVGDSNGSYDVNRLSTAPVTGQEYELVISENTDGNVRWFVNGILVQDGTTGLFNPLYLSNTEGNNRFIGNYSLIEIYNAYCNDYTEFTNMVNNA